MQTIFSQSTESADQSPAIFDNCESAYKLIAHGNEKEAKERFPLEFYLIKKYLVRSIDEFISQLSLRIGFN